MAYPERFLDELLAKTDILELIRTHTQVERRGTRWMARCPFHSEKTPSFNITPEKGMFYCFGCGAGGTALQFVMRAENLPYPDAVLYLASRAGLTVPEQENKPRGPRRERLLEIYRMAARFYYDTLSAPEGEVARQYARQRGIRPDAARRFGIGCAPDSWDALQRTLSVKGVSQDELSAAGLVSRNQRGGHYDAFRNRLMFPIFNLTGQVIAFSGRALDASPAKYKNSPETALYQKRSTLYAAHKARGSNRAFWILCEGNMDAFMLHQHGYDNAVATCGTSLTEMQARLIARHVPEIILSYDNDTAGQNATAKAITLLENAGLRVRVLALEGAKDPDEFLAQYGTEAFERLLNRSTNHIEYRLALLEGGHDLQTDMGKIEYLRKAEDLVAALSGRSERQVYAARVASRLGVDTKAVLGDVEAIRKKRGWEAKKEAEKRVLHPPRQTANPAEEQVLTLLLRYPEQATNSPLTEEHFSSEATKALFTALQTGLSPMTGDVTNEVSALAARLTAYSPLPDGGNAKEALQAGEEKLIEATLLRRDNDAEDPEEALRALYERRRRLQEK